MFVVKLDIFSEIDPEINPSFTFRTFKEATAFIKLCLANLYTVIVEFDETE